MILRKNISDMKGTVRYFLLLAGLVLCLALDSEAKRPNCDSLWVKANDYYSLGEYESALNEYEKILKEGYESSRLWFNMGNASYKLHDDGKALLYYERALKLDPANEDIKNNIEIARLKTLDKIESVPEFILSTWTKDLRNSLSSDNWSRIFLALLGATAILLLFFRHHPASAGRKVSFIAACVTFLFALIALIFALNLRSKAKSYDMGIVLAPVSNVKSAPNSTGGNLFILHEGTKIEILENVGGWSNIKLSDGRQGWILSRDYEII